MPVAAASANRPSATLRTNLSYLIPICLVATLGGLLFGYDTGVISGAIEFLTARFHLDVVMKGWASGCVLVGCAATRPPSSTSTASDSLLRFELSMRGLPGPSRPV